MTRPDPDKLLAEIRADQKSESGKLKIYLGMAAGVGKTFAMLSDALIEKNRGTDVIAGYIEPHGRKETESLATNFETIPSKVISYQGVSVREFDLDRALERKPALILVDELPHTNSPGMRHEKRWQDVAELLQAGIDVYSTMNVQHLESLNDVVSRITGVTVQETVPDSILSQSDSIELVDIPPEELIQRLKDGKIYTPDKVEHALSNFFKQGNLLALRELVLRQVADRVDAEMLKFRDTHAVKEVWQASERVMACIAPNKFAMRIVRASKRLADRLRADLVVACIESPRYIVLSAEDRERMTRALSLAERIGASTVLRTSSDVVAEITKIATERNVTLIVVGKPRRPRWREYFFGSVVDELIRKSEKVSVHVISGPEEEGTLLPVLDKLEKWNWKSLVRALGVTFAVTIFSFLFYPYFELSNLIMLYLLGTVWSASRYGKIEAILTTILGVAAFDFCFVPPVFTFAVTDVQYIVTFAVMLATGLVISALTVRLRLQSQLVSEREERTRLLFELSGDISEAKDTKELFLLARKKLVQMLNCDLAFLCHGSSGLEVMFRSFTGFESEANEQGVAQWCFENNETCGQGSDTLPGSKGKYVPLATGERVLGVLALRFEEPVKDLQTLDLIQSCAFQIAVALDRLNTLEDSFRHRSEAEREALRSTLLSSLSHDLRTPLAAITGAASGLIENKSLNDSGRVDLAETILEESGRLGRLMRNVLDITKLESGEVKLYRDWHAIEEIVGSAYERSKTQLKNLNAIINIPRDFPLLKIDGLLIEQLLVNLFENAARYAGEGAQLQITAKVEGTNALISVTDDGPGLPFGREESVFKKGFRGEPEKGEGIGLGLAICRAIATAHGGSIHAQRGERGGAEFMIRLPLEEKQPEVHLDA